jgi:hydrogenase expression/formation protein HypD
MNLFEDFKDRTLVKSILNEIHRIKIPPVKIMEVCGGHTMAIRRAGINTLLPQHISLLSGPGCPVCVTSQHDIDKAISYSRIPEVTLVTYGDLLRVPGSFSSLEKEKALGADVRIIYSTIQALEIARANPNRKIVFAAIGFETTTPATAIAIQEAQEQRIDNFFTLCAHKTMPEAMAAILSEGVKIDGYIGPGHVSAVAGSNIFEKLVTDYHIPIVISGFEPLDIVQSIYMLVKMIHEKRDGVEIQYNRLVFSSGNIKARELVMNTFQQSDCEWRGLGVIKNSGLKLKPQYSLFDAEISIPCRVETGAEPKGCICGSVLKGISIPTDCKLFGKKCTPVNPVGACMVSSEGACQAYYNYKDLK